MEHKVNDRPAPGNRTTLLSAHLYSCDFWEADRVTPRCRDPEKIKDAYTPDSIWRNRDIFTQGHEGIVRFLQNKWTKEEEYRLRKELFCFTDNKVRGRRGGGGNIIKCDELDGGTLLTRMRR